MSLVPDNEKLIFHESSAAGRPGSGAHPDVWSPCVWGGTDHCLDLVLGLVLGSRLHELVPQNFLYFLDLLGLHGHVHRDLHLYLLFGRRLLPLSLDLAKLDETLYHSIVLERSLMALMPLMMEVVLMGIVVVSR